MSIPLGKTQRLAQAAQVFSPAAPIDQYRLFAGRVKQVREVITAVNQRGRHVILFGERGVGKTSLANVLSEIVSDAGVQTLKSGTINCDANDDFVSIWRKIFRELSVYVEGPRGAGFMPQLPGLEEITLEPLATGDLSPDDVRYILSQIPQRVIVIIDEFDRVEYKSVPTLMADTIKTLSDHSVDTTLVLVGVADSVDDLIAEHQSVERPLRQIPMPRMSRQELYEIINKGLAELDMTIVDEARERIARISEGLPTYTHLLALEAVQRAIIDDRTEISEADVDAALKTAVETTQQSIRSTYHKATTSPRKDNLFGKVLLACALAPTDFLGYFATADVREPLSVIADRKYEIRAFLQHLKEFTDPRRGPVLQQVGTARRFRYRFVNPMMQPFVIMHGLATGLITGTKLQQLQEKQTEGRGTLRDL
jgi:hypothetical protein